MDSVFRQKRSYRNDCLWAFPVFVAFSVMGPLIAFLSPQGPRPFAVAAIFGGVGFVALASGIWGLLFYWRHELVVRGDHLTIRGSARKREIALTKVTEACWRVLGSKLVLRSPSFEAHDLLQLL